MEITWSKLEGTQRIGECATQGCEFNTDYRLSAATIHTDYCKNCMITLSGMLHGNLPDGDADLVSEAISEEIESREEEFTHAGPRSFMSVELPLDRTQAEMMMVAARNFLRDEADQVEVDWTPIRVPSYLADARATNHRMTPPDQIDYRPIAKHLFELLDDIDTADDLAKADDALYRNLVRQKHKERFMYDQLFYPDGDVSSFNQPPVQPERRDLQLDYDSPEGRIAAAMARGYTTPQNSHKVLDPHLIEDMAKEAWEQAQQEFGSWVNGEKGAAEPAIDAVELVMSVDQLQYLQGCVVDRIKAAATNSLTTKAMTFYDRIRWMEYVPGRKDLR